MPEPQDALPPQRWRFAEHVSLDGELAVWIYDAEGHEIALLRGPRANQLRALLLRAPQVEQAARDALDYLEEVGPHHLDAGMEKSGCDQITERLRVALGDAK